MRSGWQLIFLKGSKFRNKDDDFKNGHKMRLLVLSLVSSLLLIKTFNRKLRIYAFMSENFFKLLLRTPVYE